nr:o-succinylbenzoate synthase [Acidobacteriota bacterium]
MIIERVELFEIRLPLVHYFETSFGRTTERRIILVRVIDGEGAEGWGECTAGENPFYSDEWTESAWVTIKTFLAPMIKGREVEAAAGVFATMHRVRGHRMAKAAIETACWDLEAKHAGLPLWQSLGGVRREISCGVSIGIQATPEKLLEKIEHELAAGYQRIKLKIKPGWDLTVIERVRARFPDVPLSVDANSAYSLKDTALFRALDEFNLMMIEQPLAHDDILDHAQLQRQI